MKKSNRIMISVFKKIKSSENARQYPDDPVGSKGTEVMSSPAFMESAADSQHK